MLSHKAQQIQAQLTGEPYAAPAPARAASCSLFRTSSSVLSSGARNSRVSILFSRSSSSVYERFGTPRPFPKARNEEEDLARATASS